LVCYFLKLEIGFLRVKSAHLYKDGIVSLLIKRGRRINSKSPNSLKPPEQQGLPCLLSCPSRRSSRARPCPLACLYPNDPISITSGIRARGPFPWLLQPMISPLLLRATISSVRRSITFPLKPPEQQGLPHPLSCPSRRSNRARPCSLACLYPNDPISITKQLTLTYCAVKD